MPSSSPDTTALLEQLRTLREAWAGTRAAAGGVAAMAGFAFQLGKALTFIIGQAMRGEGTTFIEALSDIVAVDKGIVIGQAKRTLSSSAFHSALDELWQIHRLAASRTPELCPHIRFEVQAAQRTLGDWEASLRRWSPANADPTQLADFKSHVSIDVAPAPQIEAARLLVQGFKDSDPFPRIQRMLGRLLSAAPGTLDQVVEEFRIELEGLRQVALQLECRFDLWGADDRPPSDVRLEPDERLAVRLGERLTITDLREGRLCNRTIYQAVERDCEAWLAGNEMPYKLPVYWIAGRSGCGKSAALLHLAARLHAQNPDRLIFWLGDRVERIAETVRWAAAQLEEGRRVILVLDDPFTAARQQVFAREAESALAEWELVRGRSGSGGSHPPVILCCGPTEQRAAAEDLCGEHITCAGFDLPNETAHDLAELADWYRGRTGKEVAPLDGNVLLVQQVFEWTKGSIADFARRFRTRIRNFDRGEAHGAVFAMLAQILALNRLYVDYPASQLEAKRGADPVLDSAFIQLGDEEAHFDFRASPRGGVRLTHPHLANAIYTHWFGRGSDRPYRQDHLAQALTAALEQDDALPEVRHAPLWAIARLAIRTDRHGREIETGLNDRVDLIRAELRGVLARIYVTRTETDAPLEDLPVWVGLRDELALDLAPDPGAILMAAVDVAEAPQRGLRLSCHRLLAARSGAGRYSKGVAACLNRLAAWRDVGGAWHDWVPLALDFIRREGHGPILGAIADLVRSGANLPRMPQLIQSLFGLAPEEARPILLDWLRRTASIELNWSAILERLQRELGHCEESDAIAQRFLAAAPNDSVWPFVWANLLENSRGDRGALVEQGLTWLGLAGRPSQAAGEEHPGWDRVWKRLLDAVEGRNDNRLELEQAGRRWIERVDAGHEGWTRVWEEMRGRAQQADDRSELERLAILAELKLQVTPASLPGWSHVWTGCFAMASPESRPDLAQLATNWLDETHVEHLGWGFVWEALAKESTGIGRDQLLTRGLAWLEHVDPEHQSWGFVWSDVLEMGDEIVRARLIDVGIAWLSQATPGHQGFPRVSIGLLKSGSVRAAEATLEPLRQWLMDNLSHPGWRMAFDLWVMQAPDTMHEEIRTLVTATVQNEDLESADRALAWSAASRMGVDATMLETIALYLLDCPSVPISRRVDICGRILRAGMTSENRPRFIGHSMAILRLAKRDQFYWIWSALKKEGLDNRKAEFVAISVDWLAGVGSRHPKWSDIYLHTAFLDRTAIQPLAEEARYWLAETRSLEKWTKVWRAMPKRATLLSDPSMQAQALASLRQDLGDLHWALLWSGLIERAGDELRAQLIALGEPWLGRHLHAQRWFEVWRYILSSTRDQDARAGLFSVGVAALAANPDSREWFSIFRQIRECCPTVLDRPDLVAAADQWLASPDPTFRGWADVAHWRSKQRPSQWGNANIRARGHAWLESAAPANRSWSYIWRDVRAGGVSDENGRTDAAGIKWLAEAPSGHLGWPYVWRSLWEARAGVPGGRAELRVLGRAWLARGPSHKMRGWIENRLQLPRSHARP
jgi:hypothetical protein